MENTAKRLLAIFMFCSLFSIKTSNAMYDQPGDNTVSAEGSLTGQITSEESVLPENTYNLDATTDETMAEPTEDTTDVITEVPTKGEGHYDVTDKVAVEDVKIGEDEATTVVKGKKRTARTGAPKKIERAKGQPRTRAQRTSSISKNMYKSGIKPRTKKKQQVESEIETLAKFDKESGNIESFRDTVGGLKNYMSRMSILSPTEKSDMYKALSEIRFSLNKEGFTTEAHYDAVMELLSAAIEKEKLFSKRQINLFKGWLKIVEEEKADPTKRKKAISRIKKTTVKKPASRKTRTGSVSQKVR